MRKPNFFIVGAPRCGTTSMYAYLKQHPEIYVSIQKEPHFFGGDLPLLPGAIREEPLYLALFAGAGDRPRVGEASVYYLSSRRAAGEIRAFAPAAKIIVLLRDPAPMAYSLHGLYTRTGNEDLPSFAEALAAEPERREGRRIPPGAYFPAGLLYTGIARHAAKVERYLEVFGRDNVHCVVFDDFVRDTAAAYRGTLEFLGVDPRFAAELDPRRAGRRDRMAAVRQLRSTPPEVKQRMQFAAMKQHENTAQSPLPEELAARLRELFAADVARLGALLGRDLSAWTRGEAVPPLEGTQEPSREPFPRGAQEPSLQGSRTPSPQRFPEPSPGGLRGDLGRDGSELRSSGPAGDRLRQALASVRALKKIPAEIRARHERAETLERKLVRWQRVRVPDLPLAQRSYDPAWADWFAAERSRILAALAALGEPEAIVEHFGSTSVPGLSSKNIVDVVVGIDLAAGRAAAGEALGALGYESYGNSPIDPETVWFWKLEEERAFAVHLCDRRQPWLDDQMALREYLRAHAEERDRYARLKRRLAEESDRSFLQYTIGKMAMSIEMIDRARQWQAGAGSQGGAKRERSTTRR